ncbi:GlsB/YeaQ/YmgE family stress response membrane protein [Cellulomonas sp. URHD0024]|uniref:GlsB/YeaQ/YmgE family stress response membrane protein n=1 Tax=Cellulomonas sp. URHD0024 TaxID=1302620 RepID=UPI00041D87D7|nr:GlsB/YeaQ/YmgE family stress response membrane protein [Cellulomonas sp. URHD0024]
MTQHGIISAIVIGAIVGILGRLLVRGRQRISWLVTILVGIVAALVGTWLATLIGVRDTGGVDWIELALQVGLAAVFVAAVSGRRRRRSIL